MKTKSFKVLPPPPRFDGVRFSEIDPAAIHSKDWFLTVAPMLAGEASFHAIVTITPRDPEGSAPGGVTLAVNSAFDGTVYRATTAPGGQACLRDLPFGSYELRVAAGAAGESAPEENQSPRTPAWSPRSQIRAAAKDAAPGDIATEREPD